MKTVNIDWKTIPYERYWEQIESFYEKPNLNETRTVRIFTTNYCPFDCLFCSSTNFLNAAGGSENKKRANKYLNNSHGALVGFEIEGGIEAGKKFIDSLELFYHVANIGDNRSLAIHPASTTHSQLNTKDQLRAGVSESYIRLSIGIEHIDDIILDITHALNKSRKYKKAA